MGDIAHRKHEAQQRIKFFQDRIDSIQTGIAELEARVASQKAAAERAIRQAEEVCPRIETDRSRQSIRSEIDKLMQRISEELPEKEEQERIDKEYVEAMERYQKTEKAIRNEQEALQVLNFILAAYCL